MSAPVNARARIALVLLFACSLVLALPAPPTGATSLNTEAELKVVKAAYDSIRKNLYREPDTAALLTNAHQEAETILDQSLPLDALNGKDANAQWEIFAQNIRVMVGRSTVSTLAPGDLAHRLVTNMAKTIDDEHTYFIPAKQADAERRAARGDLSIVNFGFVSITVNGDTYVREVIPNSPVDEAGLRYGDRIIALNGQPVTPDTRMTLFGNPREGQTYTITVQHGGDTSPTDLTVHIHRYTRRSLTWRVLDGHIGYIQTFEFYDTIPQELDTALASLHKQNVDSIIIDLRGNRGGVSVDHVMGRFLQSGTELGISKGRRVTVRQIARSDGKPRETLPVVVLVDDASGSASEIAALAFEESGAGTVIGTKTAGALGSTSRFELGDGSLLSVTVAVYISAKGAALNTIGVSPEITVERAKSDIVAGRDPQLDAAIANANAQIYARAFGPLLAA